jgi:MFS family permease
LTIALAAAGWWYIADWPAKAKFVNEDERAFINARLKADSDATQNEAVTWSNVLEGLKDVKVWLYCAAYHTLSLPLYTLSLFLVRPEPYIVTAEHDHWQLHQPTIIKNLGYSAANAQLLTIPPYALATILTFSTAVISEKVGRRAPFIIGAALVAIIGYCILLGNTDPTHKPGVSYAGVFFAAAGIYPAVALTLSWPAVNVSGQTKRAVACGLQITIGNLGAVIGTQLYRSEDPPRYIVGHSVALAYLVGNIAVTSTIWLALSRINKNRDAKAATGRHEAWDGVWRGDQDARWIFTL